MSVEDNKELVRRMVEELWNNGDFGALDRYVGGELREEIRQHVADFRTAFSDIHVSIEDLIAEGDRVVARLVVSGTHTGPFGDAPPTGRRISFGSFRIYRLAGGRIVETWAMQDRLGLMQQVGAAPSGVDRADWGGHAGDRSPAR